MKKVTTVTFQNAYNYGATLQCYALQEVISNLGYDVSVLNYDNHRIGNQYKPIYFGNFKRSKKLFIKNVLSSSRHFIKRYKRGNAFKQFIDKNINLTTKCNYSNINCINTDYYVVGSDQVWNPQINDGFDKIYTLSFENNAKKISYAVSIGNVDFIKKNTDKYRVILSNLKYVSVREEDACEELRKIDNGNVEVVLDPTLLLNRAEWDRELDKGIFEDFGEKYICAYVVQPDKEYVKIVNELSKKTGLKVVHFGAKNPGYENVFESKYTEGPISFIETIKNAEYVVATSFHATVFSIIFHKNFFIVPHRETGARVTNLLDKFGIENRTYNSYEDFLNIDYKSIKTDWDEVDKKLEFERQKSIEWLKNALEEE